MDIISPLFAIMVVFVFKTGGSVKGRKVLGKYPDNLTDEGPITLGRGETN